MVAARSYRRRRVASSKSIRLNIDTATFGEAVEVRVGASGLHNNGQWQSYCAGNACRQWHDGEPLLLRRPPRQRMSRTQEYTT